MIHVTAVGRVTNDPELKPTNSGSQVGTFSLACRRNRPDKDGIIQSTFVQCSIWGKPAMVFAKYVSKGSLISVDGELRSRTYDDRQGVTHYVTELAVEHFEFLESKATIDQREKKQNGF